MLLPLLSSGFVYVTFIREASVQTFELVAMITPIALLPILSIDGVNREAGISPSNMVRSAILIASSVVAFAHGTATLQFVLLLPIFACIDILFKAARF